MKHALAISMSLLLFTGAASAEDTVIRIDDPAINLATAFGKQINVRFSDGFVKDRLPKADYDGLVLSEAPDGKVCLYGAPQGIAADAPAMAGFGRTQQGDISVPVADVSIRVTPQVVEGAPPVPFYNTDKASCTWAWKTGGGVGLWTEDCKFDNGHWTVSYDAANDWFTLQVDGNDPFPAVRQFRKQGGLTPEAMLPELKAQKLVLDDPECVFQQSSEQLAPAGWVTWQVVPTGKRKEAFDSQSTEDVPEPACGELGQPVDFVGYFMVHKDHPDRVFYINLGQDGTMIDAASLTINN